MHYAVHGILQARILEWVAFSFKGHLPNPGIKPRSPALQVESLPAEPAGKPKNTGVSSLSPLQWISPTQESNRGLLHCKQILYQLKYQGSPQSGQLGPKTNISNLASRSGLLRLILHSPLWRGLSTLWASQVALVGMPSACQ